MFKNRTAEEFYSFDQRLGLTLKYESWIMPYSFHHETHIGPGQPHPAAPPWPPKKLFTNCPRSYYFDKICHKNFGTWLENSSVKPSLLSIAKNSSAVPFMKTSGMSKKKFVKITKQKNRFNAEVWVVVIKLLGTWGSNCSSRAAITASRAS